MKEFNKVIGYDDVKIELERIVDMMVNPDKYQKLGVKTTKGLLLFGEPGVGKTLMAKCLIKASKRKAYTIRKNLPDGDFVKYIKSVFEKAKNNAPSIVFLDDMDKFANEDVGHKNAEEFVTIQSCIDDCKECEVFVIATTNNYEYIPDSLLRPGRFDKEITIENPTGVDAEKIIKHYLKNKKCDVDVNSKDVAKLLDGRSCASLETVINEAGVYAGYENRNKISMNDIVRSFMRIVYDAPEKLYPNDRKFLIQTAYHEAGHALLAELFEPGSVPFITVKEHNGGTEAFVHINNNKEYFESIEYMERRVMTLLAGKAAIEVVFGRIDVGCNKDINRAFNIVERFIDDYCSYGFNYFEGICQRNPEQMETNKMLLISLEMEKYYLQTKRILIENREKLDKLAKVLKEKKVMLGNEISNTINH